MNMVMDSELEDSYTCARVMEIVLHKSRYDDSGRALAMTGTVTVMRDGDVAKNRHVDINDGQFKKRNSDV